MEEKVEEETKDGLEKRRRRRSGVNITKRGGESRRSKN